MPTIDQNSLRTARDQTDRTIALVQRVIRQTGDPDGELAKAIDHFQAGRDALRRHGHDSRFDLATPNRTDTDLTSGNRKDTTP